MLIENLIINPGFSPENVRNQFEEMSARGHCYIFLRHFLGVDRYLNTGYSAPGQNHRTWKSQARLVQYLHGLMRPHLPKGKVLRWLDAGCGRGGAAIDTVRTFSAKVIGLDFTLHNLHKARDYARKFKVARSIDFVHGDSQSLPFISQSMDVVWAHETVCHYPDKEAFIKEVSRVLRPGGIFLLAGFALRDGISLQSATHEVEAVQALLQVWNLPHLYNFGLMRRCLERAGFHFLVQSDITERNILPCAEYFYDLRRFLRKPKLMGLTNLLTKRLWRLDLDNVRATIEASLPIIKQDILRYAIFCCQLTT
jgi:ubiquinone/menaquinone biosynthesis C-methylase UbiE